MFNFNKDLFGSKVEKIELEIDINDFEEEAKELEKIAEMKASKSWKNVRRAEGNFILNEMKLPNGIRKYYTPITVEKNYNLQTSRCLGIDDNCDISTVLDKVAYELAIHESDKVRLDELNLVFKEIDKIKHNSFEASSAGVEEYLKRKKSGICELGFRTPKLMKFYQELGYEKSIGYDINSFNVSIGKKLGYDCRSCDLNNFSALDLDGISLVLSYHTLTHCSNPVEVIEKIYNNMEEGTLFHIEVPIETDGPRLRYGHLFAFHEDDLVSMLVQSGFDILTIGRKTHTGGPLVERCTAIKK
jgi:hypothetical protein